MPALFRPAFCALSVAFLMSFALLASSGAVLAQAKQQSAPGQAAPAQPPALKQVALTDKQIDGVIAAQKEMDAVTEKLPENAAPDQKMQSQLDAVAKKYGFAGNEDYGNVVDNISLVLGGFDSATKKYVGPEAVIKAQIALIEADKKMPANDKKQALGALNEALKSPPPAIENKANIDLVTKYYDKLMETLGGDQN